MAISLGTALRYYKKKEVQEALVAAAREKEVAFHFNDRFGKRPDVLIYPHDVMELAKKGISSFHCSEESWYNPLDIQTGMSKKQLDELRSGWDLVLDIDCAIMEYSRICAELVIRFLKHTGVKNISCKFSGNKGFHIAVPFEAFPEHVGEVETRLLFPEAARKIAFYVKEHIEEELARRVLAFESERSGSEDAIAVVQERVGLPMEKIVRYGENALGDRIAKLDVEPFLEIDTVLISSRHLYRMPYSLHEKSGLLSLPIDPDKVGVFEKPMADPEKFFAPLAPWIDREAVTEPSARRLLVQALDYQAKARVDKERASELREERKRQAQEMEMKIESAVQPELFPPCISHMLEQGLVDGKKRAVFATILFLGKLGWSKQEVRSFLLKWNKEKNTEPLRENYILGQLRYFVGGGKGKMPPNCNNDGYYVPLGICKPDGLCRRIKNPVNYSLIKLRLKQQRDLAEKEAAAKQERKREREQKKQERQEKVSMRGEQEKGA